MSAREDASAERRRLDASDNSKGQQLVLRLEEGSDETEMEVLVTYLKAKFYFTNNVFPSRINGMEACWGGARLERSSF